MPDALAPVPEKPCTRCGGPRDTSRSRCRACHAAARRARHAANPEKRNAANRAWRAANPEKERAATRARYAANREKVCAANRARHAANPEKHNAANRARRAADPEKHRAAGRARYAANPEKALAAVRACHAANPEKYRAAERAWRAANPGKRCDAHARRRARKAGAPVVERVDRAAIIARDRPFGCYLCGEPLPAGPAGIHLDHAVPLSAGGDHSARNLFAVHAACNLRKNTAGWLECAAIAA